jgi:sugar/nucleoside kinase (ribokinase family)
MSVDLVLIGHVGIATDRTPSGIVTYSGGSGFAAAVAASALHGGGVGLVTQVGEDFDLAILGSFGLNVEGVAVQPGASARFVIDQSLDGSLSFHSDLSVAAIPWPCRRLVQGFRLGNFAMVGISIEGSTPEVHRAMRGDKADLAEVIEAARIVARESGVSLKLATVVSDVNRAALPDLARTVRDISADVWRLYQYSSRGDQNVGQQRHWLPDGEFRHLAAEAAALASPVPTAPSTEAESEGCLIVDPAGNVLQPGGAGYVRLGNCLTEPLDYIWAKLPIQSAIIKNKRWLSVVS